MSLERVVFRPAAGEDIDAVLSLVERYYAEEGLSFSEDSARGAVRGLLRDPSLGRLWLVLDGEVAVGYLVLTLGYSLECGGRDAFLDEIFLAPSHRGRGIGRRALALAERACSDLGVGALHLEVKRGKAGTLGFYRRAGFADRDGRLMTKRIAPRPGKRGA